MRYDSDKTLGHREYWQSILAEVRAEMSAADALTQPAAIAANSAAGVDVDSLSESELERLTRPEATNQQA